MGNIRTNEGFTEPEQGRISALHWEAFGRKLRPGFINGATARKARQAGAKTVKLSVIDENPRTRDLYEHLGFKPTGHEPLVPLAPLYGFNGYNRMELNVRS